MLGLFGLDFGPIRGRVGAASGSIWGRLGGRFGGRFRIDSGPVGKACPTLPTLVNHEEGPNLSSPLYEAPKPSGSVDSWFSLLVILSAAIGNSSKQIRSKDKVHLEQ